MEDGERDAMVTTERWSGLVLTRVHIGCRMHHPPVQSFSTNILSQMKERAETEPFH